MVWCVANKEMTKYLKFNDNDEPEITGKYIESAAFDSPCEAKEWATKTPYIESETPKGSDIFSAQLR